MTLREFAQHIPKSGPMLGQNLEDQIWGCVAKMNAAREDATPAAPPATDKTEQPAPAAQEGEASTDVPAETEAKG